MCDFIKVEYDEYAHKNVPRKYFSGGLSLGFGEGLNNTFTTTENPSACSVIVKTAKKIYNFTANLLSFKNASKQKDPENADLLDDDSVPQIFKDLEIPFEYEARPGSIDLRSLVATPFSIMPKKALTNIVKFSFGVELPYYIADGEGHYTKEKEVSISSRAIFYWDLGYIVRLIAHEIGHSIESHFSETEKQRTLKDFNIIRKKMEDKGYRLLLESDEVNILNVHRKKQISFAYFRDPHPSQFLAEFFRYFLIDGDELRKVIKSESDENVKEALEDIYALFKEKLGQEFFAKDIAPLTEILSIVKKDIATKAKEDFEKCKELGYPFLEESFSHKYGVTVDHYETLLKEAKGRGLNNPTYEMMHEVTLQILEEEKLAEEENIEKEAELDTRDGSFTSSPSEEAGASPLLSANKIIENLNVYSNEILTFKDEQTGLTESYTIIAEKDEKTIVPNVKIYLIDSKGQKSTKPVVSFLLDQSKNLIYEFNMFLNAVSFDQNTTDKRSLAGNRSKKQKGLGGKIFKMFADSVPEGARFEALVTNRDFQNLLIEQYSKGKITSENLNEVLKETLNGKLMSNNNFVDIGIHGDDSEGSWQGLEAVREFYERIKNPKNDKEYLLLYIMAIKKESAGSTITTREMAAQIVQFWGSEPRVVFQADGMKSFDKDVDSRIAADYQRIDDMFHSFVFKFRENFPFTYSGLLDGSIYESLKNAYDAIVAVHDSYLNPKGVPENYKGKISILITVEKDNFVISIFDNGIGDSVEEKDFKERKKYLLDPSRQTVYLGGEGIGETIFKKVKSKGGDVILEKGRLAQARTESRIVIPISAFERKAQRLEGEVKANFEEFKSHIQSCPIDNHDSVVSLTSSTITIKDIEEKGTHLKSYQDIKKLNSKKTHYVLHKVFGICKIIEAKEKRLVVEQVVPPKDTRGLNGLFARNHSNLIKVFTVVPGSNRQRSVLYEDNILIPQEWNKYVEPQSEVRKKTPKKIVDLMKSLVNREDLECGMIGRVFNQGQQLMFDELYGIFIKHNMAEDVAENLANNLTRMKSGSIEIIYLFEIIDQRQSEALKSHDYLELRSLKDKEKEDLALSLQSIVEDYDGRKLTAYQKEKLLKRLVPFEVVDYLADKYRVPRDRILFMMDRHPNFPIWIPKAMKKAEEIKDEVGGLRIAQRVVVSQGIEKTDEWVEGFKRLSNKNGGEFLKEVGGLSNLVDIATRQGLGDAESWIAEKKTKFNLDEKIYREYGGRSRVWQQLIKNGKLPKKVKVSDDLGGEGGDKSMSQASLNLSKTLEIIDVIQRKIDEFSGAEDFTFGSVDLSRENQAKCFVSFFEYRARVNGLDTFDRYLDFINSNSRQALEEIQAILELRLDDPQGETITSFYRLASAYEAEYQEFLEDLIRKKNSDNKSITIRHVSGSTGQEVVTNMIMIYEALRSFAQKQAMNDYEIDKWIKTWNLRVDDFDISLDNFLEIEKGRYSIDYLRENLQKYFKSKGEDDNLSAQNTRLMISQYFDSIDSKNYQLKENIRNLFDVQYHYVDLEKFTNRKILTDKIYDVTFSMFSIIYFKGSWAIVLKEILNSQSQDGFFISDICCARNQKGKFSIVVEQTDQSKQKDQKRKDWETQFKLAIRTASSDMAAEGDLGASKEEIAEASSALFNIAEVFGGTDLWDIFKEMDPQKSPISIYLKGDRETVLKQARKEFDGIDSQRLIVLSLDLETEQGEIEHILIADQLSNIQSGMLA
ncbi:MAG: hypothetical protein PHY73_08655 [Candidatus Omnitrophica bacterium]|nr:hypothetical protein [Candidatus Omnitrophota bacterium]